MKSLGLSSAMRSPGLYDAAPRQATAVQVREGKGMPARRGIPPGAPTDLTDRSNPIAEVAGFLSRIATWRNFTGSAEERRVSKDLGMQA